MQPVLIVDDSDVLRNALKSVLRSQFPSIEIVEAASGKEALCVLQQINPLLIFMDIRLPDKSGLKITKAIKDARPEIDVIILTTHDGPEYREAAVNSGASRFLTKANTGVDVITALVASALRSKDKEYMAGTGKMIEETRLCSRNAQFRLHGCPQTSVLSQ